MTDLTQAIAEVKRIAASKTEHMLTPHNEHFATILNAVASSELIPATNSFQARVQPWMLACFGEEISGDKLERGDRLLEEVLELLQSGDYPKDRVASLVGYVWSRPVGEPAQEVGGVMVTLAAYCLAYGLDMNGSAETELARIWTKVEKIRAKQAAKPKGIALPQEWPVDLSGETIPQADHKLAAALMVEKAADSLLECSVWCDSQERTDDWWRNGVTDARKHHMARILALAPADALAEVQALRAELAATKAKLARVVEALAESYNLAKLIDVGQSAEPDHWSFRVKARERASKIVCLIDAALKGAKP